MSNFKHTPLDEIPKIYEKLRQTFESGKTLPLTYRRAQLLALGHLLQDNKDAILNAIYIDVGRQKLEACMPELGPVIASVVNAVEQLESWMTPEKPHSDDPLRSTWGLTVHKAPKGVVINIAPWNYPVIIATWPLVGAIAAGCTCVVKPSELSPTTSALLADLLPRYLDPDAYAIVNGGVPETESLLSLKWDHIFFTGSTRVGRLIAMAAAKQLTPVTLELGGKSPVWIDAKNTDLDVAASRTLWGRIQNAGQLCVSPDYILVPRDSQDALVAALTKTYDAFWPYPKASLDPKSELGHIVNGQDRIMGLIKGTKGTIVKGGQTEGKRIALTIVKDVKLDDVLMKDEIFGPILPIVPVDDIDEAIRVIKNRPTPLVIYLFTESVETKNQFLQRTRSGSLILNDVFSQLSVIEMPFGGCGDSGMGQYLGKHSFNTFTHLRSSSNVPIESDSFLKIRYPPYTEEAFEALTGASRLKMPDA